MPAGAGRTTVQEMFGKKINARTTTNLLQKKKVLMPKKIALVVIERR